MAFFITKERYTQQMIDHDLQTTGIIGRFNHMLNTCQKRCLKNDGDKLTKGENLCIDKCTIKYYKVVDMMDTLMQKKMQDQKEKMESLLEAQSGTENSINDTAGK